MYNISQSSISSDMVKHQSTIMALRHSYDSKDLEDTIRRVMTEHPSSNAFLIKMEIMKLSQTTHHAIDLREHFKNQCKSFQLAGVTHYLDPETKKLLELEYKKYGERLTNGVIEVVLSDANQRYKAIPAGTRHVTIPDAIPMSFTKFYRRQEERIYFTKNVKMYYTDPTSMNTKEREQCCIKGVTTNISRNGISIRFESSPIIKRKGDIYIHMHEIEREYAFQSELIIPYRIINNADKNDNTYLMLVALKNNDHVPTKEFNFFVNNFVKTQRGKHKISVENTEDAVNIKVNEQYIMTRLDTLPLYYSQDGDKWNIEAKLITDNNSHIGKIGNRENNSEFIASISKAPFLQELLRKEKSFHEFVFVFPVESNTGVVFVALPYSVILKNKIYTKHLNLSHEKGNLNLYKIDGSIIDAESEYYVPSSLPQEVIDKINCRNKEPMGLAKEFAKNISRMINITDLTSSITTLNLLTNLKSEDGEVTTSDIKDFALMVPKDMPKIHESRSESNDFRIEERFKYQTEVKIRSLGTSCSSDVLGKTDNLSSRGMRIKLNAIPDLDVGDEIVVSLPRIKTRDNEKFIGQPYKIVGKVNDTDFRLQILGNPREHIGRKILQRFIYENVERMVHMDVDREIHGLSRILRNIFTKNSHSNFGIVARNASMRYIKNIVFSDKQGFIDVNPFIKSKDKALIELMKEDSLRSAIAQRMSIIVKNNPYETMHVVVIPRKRQSGHVYYVTKVVENLSSKSNIQDILRNTKSIGDFKLLRIKITKKGRVLNKYFSDELTYLEKYSGAKATRIEKGMRDTTGVIEIIDITDLSS